MDVFLALHLITIVPVLLIGPFLLARKKGDRLHVTIGRVWAVLMVFSCLVSFGVLSDGGLSWLHGLSAFTLFSVVRAVLAIRKGDLKAHKRAMIGSYIGTVVAFIFAAAIPDRLIGSLLRRFFFE